MKKVTKQNDIAIYWLENENPFFLICPWQGVHFKRGIERGLQSGRQEGRKEMILNALKKGSSAELISSVMGIPLEKVQAVEKESL